MTECHERMRRKRGTIRTSTTKLLTRLEEEINKDNADCEQLRELLSLLSTREESLSELDKHIEDETPTDELEDEVESTQEYKDRIVLWKGRATRLIQCSSRDSTTRQSDVSASAERSHNRQPVKLPKLIIDKYDGEISAWQEFWNQYETAIHLNDALCKREKFTYLKSYLTGVAAKAVAGLTLSDSNYDAAITLLNDRFGRKDLVVNAHMSKLLNLTPVKKSYDITALRQLYDECEIQICSSESAGIHCDTYGSLLCPILMQLIPNDIALNYTHQAGTNDIWSVHVHGVLCIL